jgi:hypothetical protein
LNYVPGFQRESNNSCEELKEIALSVADTYGPVLDAYKSGDTAEFLYLLAEATVLPERCQRANFELDFCTGYALAALTISLATGAISAELKAAAQTSNLLSDVIRHVDEAAPGAIDDTLIAPRTGAGGDWDVIDEVPGGAVGQTHLIGCVEACGEMLAGVPQSALSANSSEALAALLGGSWRGGYVGPGQFDALMGTGSWGAELFVGGSVPHHMVVVDGFGPGGNLLIRDPWAGGEHLPDD